MKNWLKQRTKLSSTAKKIWIPTLLGLLITFVFYEANLKKPAVIEQLGNLLFDSYQQRLPREYNHDQPVSIVDIDEESLKRLGQWPWPRTTMAKLNDRLTDAGAVVIAYDVIFSEADRTSPENMLATLKDNPTAKGEFENIKALTGHDDLFAASFQKYSFATEGPIRVVAGYFLVKKETEARPRTCCLIWTGTPSTDEIDNYHGAIMPLPKFLENASGQGYVSFDPAGDGIVRTAPLISRIPDKQDRLADKYHRALSLEAIRVLHDPRMNTFIQSANSQDEASGFMEALDSKNTSVASIKVGEFKIPVDKKGHFRVYFSKPIAVKDDPRYVSAWEVLSDDPDMQGWKDKIYGRIVFIGTGAEGLKDIVATPVAPAAPGVLVHAQVAEQILSEVYLRRPYWVEFTELTILIISGLLLAFALPRLSATKGAILSALLGLSVAYGSWHAFKNDQLLFNPIYILLAVLTIYVAMTLLSFYMTESERSRIRNAFSMYLSPAMVKKVSEDPSLLSLGGVERNMTVLFLDIRSFSKISESLTPQEITTFLNIFLTPMTNLLQQGKATIDKYIGDAIVAFWNAPLDDDNHEKNAAKTVIKMLKSLDDLNAKYEDDPNIKWPKDVKMGIGLNTGICCVGNLGSDQRFSYSMIGDSVNLAARIEGLTKQYKVSVLIGEGTAEKIPEMAIIEADLIQVVGRQRPERIYILAGTEDMAGSDDYKALMPLHDAFLHAHRAQNWDEAERLIAQLKPLAKPMGFDGYYDVMQARIDIYRTDPPPQDWGGVYVATSK